MRLAEEVRFALRKADGAERVVLLVSGVCMARLPDLVDIQRAAFTELGDKLDKYSLLQWWMQNKDVHAPVEQSKFRRVGESIFSIRAFRALPNSVQAESFWGLFHASDSDLREFMFYFDDAREVRVLAKIAPPKADEEHLWRENAAISRKTLQEQRETASTFASSAINVGAMLYASEVGQLGAKASIIIKLYSAADWWGEGSSGWQRWDKSWLCTDKKDMLGRIVKPQGRILWRGELGSVTPSVQVNRGRKAGSVNGALKIEAVKSTRSSNLLLLFRLALLVMTILVACAPQAFASVKTHSSESLSMMDRAGSP